jgi:hypothetical protein
VREPATRAVEKGLRRIYYGNPLYTETSALLNSPCGSGLELLNRPALPASA